jgi:hypothetical protein
MNRDMIKHILWDDHRNPVIVASFHEIGSELSPESNCENLVYVFLCKKFESTTWPQQWIHLKKVIFNVFPF